MPTYLLRRSCSPATALESQRSQGPERVGTCSGSIQRETSGLPWGTRQPFRRREGRVCAGWVLTRLLLSSQLLLLHYKASPEVQDNNGCTALHLACTYGHEDVSGAPRLEDAIFTLSRDTH